MRAPRAAGGSRATRRRFVAGLALAASLPVTLRSRAASRVRRVAILGVTTPEGYAPQVEALRRGLRERGHVEGGDLVIDERWAYGQFARLPVIAEELLRARPDVLVTSGPGTTVARQATSSVPIVMAVSNDAVATRAVQSFARPGGNVTGSSVLLDELNAKRLQVLKQGVERARRVAVLLLRGSTMNDSIMRAMTASGAALGVQLQRVEVADAGEIGAAFRAMQDQRADGLVVYEHPMLVVEAQRVAMLARQQSLPAIGFAEFARAGGLLGYGVDFTLLWHRAAYFVDRILKGTKPEELPVEQASSFELVINLGTARSLGVTVPESLRVRADRVIA